MAAEFEPVFNHRPGIKTKSQPTDSALTNGVAVSPLRQLLAELNSPWPNQNRRYTRKTQANNNEHDGAAAVHFVISRGTELGIGSLSRTNGWV